MGIEILTNDEAYLKECVEELKCLGFTGKFAILNCDILRADLRLSLAPMKGKVLLSVVGLDTGMIRVLGLKSYKY